MFKMNFDKILEQLLRTYQIRLKLNKKKLKLQFTMIKVKKYKQVKRR